MKLFAIVPESQEKRQIFDSLMRGGNVEISYKQIQLRCKPAGIRRGELDLMPIENPQLTSLIPTGQKILVTFDAGNDSYFIETSIISVESSTRMIRVLIDMPLFRMQRRKVFRYRVPTGYPAALKITEVNGTPLEESYQVTDLNTNGCQVNVQLEQQDSIPIRSHVKCELHMGDLPSLSMQASIRYIRLLNPMTMVMGLQFHTGIVTDSHSLPPSKRGHRDQTYVTRAIEDELEQRILHIKKALFHRRMNQAA